MLSLRPLARPTLAALLIVFLLSGCRYCGRCRSTEPCPNGPVGDYNPYNSGYSGGYYAPQPPPSSQYVPKEPAPIGAPSDRPMGPTFPSGRRPASEGEFRSHYRSPFPDIPEEIDSDRREPAEEARSAPPHRSFQDRFAGLLNPRKNPKPAVQPQARAQTAPHPATPVPQGDRRAYADDKVASRPGPVRNTPTVSPASRRVVAPMQPVTLGPPPEIYQFADEPLRRSLLPVPTTTRPATERPEPVPVSGQLPHWPAHKANMGTGTHPRPVADPPALQATPAAGEVEARRQPTGPLAVGTLAVCREVRAFGDVTPLDHQRLKPGQPVLLYANLTNYHTLSTSRGYRTLTLSALEIRDAASGEIVERQPLGTAADISDAPRKDFFLTHQVTIPEDLPQGDYVLQLNVHDLLGRQSARAELPIRISPETPRPAQ